MFSDSAEASLNLAGVKRQPDAGLPDHPQLRLRGAPSCALPDGRVIDLEAKDALLLAFLAIEGQTSRAILAERLWPDVDAERARGNLRARLLRIKQRVGAELIGPGSLAMLAAGVTHDLDDTSDVLAPVALEGAGGFAEWLEATRLARRARRGEQLAAASAQAEAAGRLATALEQAQALVALDPLSEHAHRRVMRLHYLRGDAAAARAVYQRCADVLLRELNAKPSRETEELLRQLDASASRVPTRVPLPITVLRPPRLVGREDEAAALAAAWHEGQPVLVIGEAGMGKSRLLAEFTDGSTASASARPGDASVPFAAAARLLRAVIGHAPEVAPASRARLAALLPEYAESDAKPAANLTQLAHVVQDILDVAAAAGLTTVLLDDLHFADDATLDLLREVLGGEPGALHWGFAQRPAETSVVAQALVAGLAQARRLVTIELAPLSVDAMSALIESLRVPQLAAARLAPALVQHTGGNPLFALETIKQMLVEGGPAARGTQLPAPSNVGALIAHRLKQLSPRALALARLAAIAGPDFSANLAERILATPALELADGWAELEAAQVLRDAAFAHDLVYEATLAGVPTAIARELHTRVADELEAHSASAERIAAHRIAAADPRRSIPALRAAAAAAEAKFQRPIAAQWLDQAAQMLEQIGDQAEAFAVLAQAVQLRQGFDTGVRHDEATQRLLALAVTPAQRAEALTARSVYLHILGRSAETLPLLAEGLVAARTSQEELSVSRVLNVQGIVLRRLGRNDEAIVALREALAITRRLDPTSGDDLPAILNNLALAQMEADDHVTAILHFEESARLQPDTLTRARVLNNLALSLEEVGSVERAYETRLTAQRLLRGQDGADFARLNLLISLAACSRYLQRYGEAISLLEQVQSLAATTSHWRVEDLHVQRAFLWIELGAWRAADEAFAAVETGRQMPPPVRAGVLMARAMYQLARNLDATATVAEAEKLLAGVDERRIWRRLRVVKIRCLPPSEGLALALAELEREATRGNRASQIPFATLAARAHLALGDAHAALRMAQRALEGLKGALPAGFSPFEVRFTLSEALAAVDAAAAAEEVRRLADDLQQVAATQVPEAYRRSYLQGVTLHRHILAAAERAAARTRLQLLKR
ncbi:MAG TPA: AAA family ATPase [Burkholderiaceae bacterium]|nr:AAA family ATPase [Burkholderiaceae bacterium]